MINELEPRYKTLFIPHHFVLECVIFCLTGNDGYPPRWKIINAFVDGYGQIPHDTEIRHVTIPFTRRGFLFTLYHKSFDVVGDFAEIPEIEWSIEREIVETVEPESETFNARPFIAEQLKEAEAVIDAHSKKPFGEPGQIEIGIPDFVVEQMKEYAAICDEMAGNMHGERLKPQPIPAGYLPKDLVEQLKEEVALKESMSGISEPLSKYDPVINFFK